MAGFKLISALAKKGTGKRKKRKLRKGLKRQTPFGSSSDLLKAAGSKLNSSHRKKRKKRK